MSLEDELSGFTGTTQYHRNFTGLLYTDGVAYLAERAECYWLIDLVGSYQADVRNVPFQLWELRVSEDRSAIATMREDTGQPAVVEQRIEYTDFPLDEFSFYCIQNVMLLKSEY